MVDIRAKWRPAGTLAIAGLTAFLPACQSVGRPPSPVVRSPDDGSRRFALRPILNGEGYRPYYIGGYAGASYGPGLFSRGPAVSAPFGQPAGPPNVTVNRGTWEPE